ncbi:MAG TPA: hypothetical protein VN956_25490 [Pyrinomonadaceae bacterium]|nr:hypothetical protein [Pyrinomonadaceae bacterium]
MLTASKRILDCESVPSIYESLHKSFGIDEGSLNEWFDELGAELAHLDEASDEFLLRPIKNLVVPDKPFDTTFWFHLTRTLRSTTFTEGILPLPKVLDSLWEALFELAQHIVSREDWDQFRLSLSGIYEYNSKLEDAIHWGPYGFLILPLAMADYTSSQTFSHYLTSPEIIEDICGHFREDFNFDLLAAFQECTVARIIKFEDHKSKLEHLCAAIRYLYFVYHGKYPDVLNPIFSGEVGYSQIQKEVLFD